MVAEALRRSGVPARRILIETFGATPQSQSGTPNESVAAPWIAFGLTALFVTYAAMGWPNLPIPGWPQDIFASLHQTWTGSFVTGLLLLTLLFAQSRLAYLRSIGRWSSATKHKRIHQWLGAATPVLLAVHTSKFGYGIALALSTCLLLATVGGLALQPALAGTRLRGFLFALHMALGVALVGLLVTHVWIAVTY